MMGGGTIQSRSTKNNTVASYLVQRNLFRGYRGGNAQRKLIDICNSEVEHSQSDVAFQGSPKWSHQTLQSPATRHIAIRLSSQRAAFRPACRPAFVWRRQKVPIFNVIWEERRALFMKQILVASGDMLFSIMKALICSLVCGSCIGAEPPTRKHCSSECCSSKQSQTSWLDFSSQEHGKDFMLVAFPSTCPQAGR